jgi:ferritin-like metal-binding protein YciE
MKLESIDDVYLTQLGDLRSGETQLIEALPAMVEAASDRKLQAALTRQLEQAERHLERLEQIVTASPATVPDEPGEAMRGLIREASTIAKAEGPDEVRDVALIAAAQRVAHYEIAVYGTARALADQLDLAEARDLLAETLEEEREADEALTKLAVGGLIVSGLNERAQP